MRTALVALLLLSCGRTTVYELVPVAVHDAGTPDAGTPDAGHDAGTPDAGLPDAGTLPACCGAGPVDFLMSCDGTTCRSICVSPRTPQGCIPSGGIDDTLGVTDCCSGAAVAGSTCCLVSADYNHGWLSCVQTCR